MKIFKIKGYMIQEKITQEYADSYLERYNELKDTDSYNEELVQMMYNMYVSFNKRVGKWHCYECKIEKGEALMRYTDHVRKNNIGSEFRIIRCDIEHSGDGFWVIGQEPDEFEIIRQD